MDRIETFEAWAPPDSPWSVWAKPVLFAEAVAESFPQGALPAWRELDVAWAPAAAGQTALVLDLPGQDAVALGLALAARGYRPVPLFNGARGPQAVVNVDGLLHLLLAAAPDLKALSLAPNAPPAFLLDSNRLGNVSPSPGRFDNRWVVFPQDFPSANFLLAQGIGCVLLVQPLVQQPQRDLAHVLLRWQEGRLALMGYGVQAGGSLEPLTVSRPSYFKQLWYRALVLAGLRRHSGGGFGALIPEDSGAGIG